MRLLAHSTRILAGIGALALSGVMVTGSATASQPADERRAVCIDTTVHDVDSGTYLGKLFPNDTIHIDTYTEYWAHGFAYGNVNKYGRVLRANLCP